MMSKNLDWVQNLHWPCRNASANFYRILYCLGSAIRFEESDGFTHHLARQFGRYPPSHKASAWQARLWVNYGVAGFFSTSDTNAS